VGGFNAGVVPNAKDLQNYYGEVLRYESARQRYSLGGLISRSSCRPRAMRRPLRARCGERFSATTSAPPHRRRETESASHGAIQPRAVAGRFG
jgi:hypothetical protein